MLTSGGSSGLISGDDGGGGLGGGGSQGRAVGTGGKNRTWDQSTVKE